MLASAQLVTNNSLSPAQLVQNVLLGQGVTATNISFTGHADAIAEFNGTATGLGFAGGIIMTTGTTVNNGQGPHGPNISGSSGEDNFEPGYALLESQINNEPTYNAAVLEFDFVPTSDSIQFRYIFGSEEYAEYVGSDYNDIFGFFISGPGFTGNENIALIPGTTLPVTISNLNNGTSHTGPCTNCQFYRQNEDGSFPGIQYDAITTTLTAQAEVVCGQTYHLTFAIADVFDGAFDSGIFLEAGSFSSPSNLEVSNEIDNDVLSNDSIMAEGCSAMEYTIKRFANIDQALDIPIGLTGSAQDGLDFTGVPDTLHFNPGENEQSFSVQGLADAVVEPLEDLTIIFEYGTGCGGPNTYPRHTLWLENRVLLDGSMSDTTITCNADSISIGPIISGGNMPYQWIWEDGSNDSTITILPAQTTTYTVKIFDECLSDTTEVSATVFVEEPEPVQVELPSIINERCEVTRLTLQANISGNSAITNFGWIQNGTQMTSTNNPLNFNVDSGDVIIVYAEDLCGFTDADTTIISIDYEPMQFSLSGPSLACPGEPAIFQAQIIGGREPITYNWNGQSNQPNIYTSYGEEDEIVMVEVYDSCAVNALDFIFLERINLKAEFTHLEQLSFTNTPQSFYNSSQGADHYFWDFGNGNFSSEFNPVARYDEPGKYMVRLEVESDLGCTDSAFHLIEIDPEHYLYIPNAFTPDNDDFNQTFKVSGLGYLQAEISIWNRWGELVFQSSDLNFEWDGKNMFGKECEGGVYTYKLSTLNAIQQEQLFTGQIFLIR